MVSKGQILPYMQTSDVHKFQWRRNMSHYPDSDPRQWWFLKPYLPKYDIVIFFNSSPKKSRVTLSSCTNLRTLIILWYSVNYLKKKSIYDKHQNTDARSEVLTVVTMKITVFWDVTPCGLVEIYSHSRGYTSIFSKVENFYQTTWHHIPKHRNTQWNNTSN